jgi:hypothetical protein
MIVVSRKTMFSPELGTTTGTRLVANPWLNILRESIPQTIP